MIVAACPIFQPYFGATDFGAIDVDSTMYSRAEFKLFSSVKKKKSPLSPLLFGWVASCYSCNAKESQCDVQQRLDNGVERTCDQWGTMLGDSVSL